MSARHYFYFFSLILLLITTTANATAARWQFLQQNIGVVAMHMQLLYDDHVIIFDRTDFGPSNLTLPTCQSHRPHVDCTAHSVEYDPLANTFRPLDVITDVWCSSGSVSPNGTMVQTGGYGAGSKVVRTFTPCETASSCDWDELGNQLFAQRWYATNHILPAGEVIIIGGHRTFSYEFYPKSPSSKLYSLPFLVQTTDPAGLENNLYPFVFLNSDGNLFIFANNRSILFNYVKNDVVWTYPVMPGGGSRCYPSTGSAVLLPIREPETGLAELEVMVCGGTPSNSYFMAKNHSVYPVGLSTCGRIKINDPNPNWAMEIMPMPRIMSDMLLLPNGEVLIINGAGSGSAGWEYGRDPVLSPLIYNPDREPGSRFDIQTPTTIPRMYHSSAIVLRDGRVLVGGSNPHAQYKFKDVLFPTELRLEAFLPPYLDPSLAHLRPNILSPASQSKIGYGQVVEIRFQLPFGLVQNSKVEVTFFSPPFSTHSFSMNHRMLVLGAVGGVTLSIDGVYSLTVKTPSSMILAPKGYYLMFVIHQDVPSEGIWVQISD